MLSGSRIFSISCLETLETSVLVLGQDLGLIMALRGAMTLRLTFSVTFST